jgi:hypothetical protein
MNQGGIERAKGKNPYNSTSDVRLMMFDHVF